MLSISLLLSAIFSLIVCAKLADEKGRSVGGWIVGAFFLEWIAVIILCCLSDLSYSATPKKSICDVPLPQTRKIPRVGKYKCDHCGEIIDTIQCPWCGHRREEK